MADFEVLRRQRPRVTPVEVEALFDEIVGVRSLLRAAVNPWHDDFCRWRVRHAISAPNSLRPAQEKPSHVNLGRDGTTPSWRRCTVGGGAHVACRRATCWWPSMACA
jgi:hypothetical protein